MKSRIINIIIIFLIISCCGANARAQMQDSSLNIWMIETNYSFHVPGGDLANRFGLSNTIGAGLTLKTRWNISIGVEGNYMFGGHLKDGTSILSNLMTESGNIINMYGEYGTIALTQRGMYAGIKTGLLIPILSPNPNSGFVLNIGVGWLHHKIRIENKDNNVPPVINDYKKGYDRLTGGLALREFVGYQYLSNNEMINFYAGFEFYQAKTKSLRAYDFDRMERDTEDRRDYLYGFRVGWIFTLYNKQPDKYYYY